MKLLQQNIAIFLNLLLTVNIYNLYPLQVENCDSNARLIVGAYFIAEYRLGRVNEHVQYELKNTTIKLILN